MPDKEWFTVATVTTNNIPDSVVTIYVDRTPICPNVSNREFRARMMKLRDIAIRLIDDRIIAIATMWPREQERIRTWLGKADDEIRQTLIHGLPRLQAVLRELKPENLVRYDDELGKTLSCVPVADSGMNDASVCKPDSAKRIIQFYSHFCTLPDVELRRDC
jgi:hypothetical protein